MPESSTSGSLRRLKACPAEQAAGALEKLGGFKGAETKVALRTSFLSLGEASPSSSVRDDYLVTEKTIG